MIRRRLVALLTSVTLLHLSVASGESACASPAMMQHSSMASSAGSEPAVPMSGHAMPMGAADGAVSVRQGTSDITVANADMPPCEIPTQQHCCGAVVGCSVSIAIGTTSQIADSSVTPAVRILVALHDAPASFAPAPEPPPPKA